MPAEEKDRFNREICNTRHRWLNWVGGGVASLLVALLGSVWVAIVSSGLAAQKAQDAAYQIQSYAAKSDERAEKYNERDRTIRTALDDIKAEQRRMNDKLDTVLRGNP